VAALALGTRWAVMRLVIPLLEKAMVSKLAIFPSLVKEGWPRHLKSMLPFL